MISKRCSRWGSGRGWSAERRAGLWPASFVAAMVFGAAAGWSCVAFPAVETAIAASVLVLGGAIAAGWSPAVAVGALLIAAFGLTHGYAHGAEMPGDSFRSGYAAGFVAGTTLLHGLGLALASALAAFGARKASRVAGGALASFGLVLLAGTLAG
nr:HupE/UreJ family protein [Elioraea tepida]